MPRPLVLLGFGDAARALAPLVVGTRTTYASTRRREREAEIAAAGLVPLVADALSVALVAPIARDADVVVSFPPDGETDARLAPACAAAANVVYVSSTGVYGTRRGIIDETTPVDENDARARPRLLAEDAWRAIGAAVLRVPGLYGAHTGLHVRLRAGTYRLPGDGSGVISRLHLGDLARALLAALAPEHRGATYVLGDRAPAPHAEVVAWLCARMGLPMPPSVPLSEAPPSLRGDRAVDPRRALDALGLTLAYPTYREGFAAALADAPTQRESLAATSAADALPKAGG